MIYSTGKRKTSIAKVWLDPKAKGIMVNERTLEQYFSVLNLEQKVLLPQNIISTILKQKQIGDITSDSLFGIVSIKGNSLSQSFYDYINSLSADLVSSILSDISKLNFNIQVVGGGIKGQAEAIMYGIAKTIALFKPELQKILKDLGFLTRDFRTVERKKPGLRKARKKEQYSKR